MSEAMVNPDIGKEAQEFKAGKTGEEAWVEKILARRAEERAREKITMKAQLEDGSVAKIYPEFAGTKFPVELEFCRAPRWGELLYLEKPEQLTSEGMVGFRKFFRAEEPMRGVERQEGTVYLRAVPVPPEEFEARKAEARDMRDYLTPETLAQLGL